MIVLINFEAVPVLQLWYGKSPPVPDLPSSDKDRKGDAAVFSYPEQN